MKFVNVSAYVPDAKKVEAVRPVHRAYMQGLRDQGKVVIAGPFQDGAGALIVYEAETADEANTLAVNDPYFKEGIWTQYEIHPWEILGVDYDLLPR